MTTITDIRDQLIEVFNGLRDGTIAAKDAVEVNNTAGKIIATAKAQIAYHALRGEAPNIPFLAAQSVRIAGEGPQLTIASEQKEQKKR